MRVVVTVPLPDRKTGEPRILKTHMFDFFGLSADEASERATVRFGLPKRLQPVPHRVDPLGSHQGRGRVRHDQQIRHRTL